MQICTNVITTTSSRGSTLLAANLYSYHPKLNMAVIKMTGVSEMKVT